MKTIAAIVLLSCCALAQDKRAISRAEVGCGPQDAKYEVKSDESQHPTPTPEDSKALIYVVADGHLTTISDLTKGGWVPSMVEGTSSCQSTPVNTMYARCCNPLLTR
jgi:hypothetical protein